jgi:hypothetical protein
MCPILQQTIHELQGGCYVRQLGFNLKAPLSHVLDTLSKIIPKKFESCFAKTMERLACLAKSTPTSPHRPEALQYFQLAIERYSSKFYAELFASSRRDVSLNVADLVHIS